MGSNQSIMAAITPSQSTEKSAARRENVAVRVQKLAALVALVGLTVFGAARYPGFFGTYNLGELVRSNALYGLIALGMTFVILTGGIDLSVGSVAALASVVAAGASPHGTLIALSLAILAGGAVGLLNGLVIVRGHVLPFIATLATLLAARGLALLLAHNASVSVDTTHGFANIAQSNVGIIPVPALILVAAFALGSLALNFTPWGRTVLAIGGGEEAARLMGLPTDRVKIGVYALSGALAGLAGALLAALTFTGLPTEGAGWELSAIASVVVGGTLLSGGAGSVGMSLVGTLLLGLIFNILNFENGRGTVSLSAYWQSVIRGVFLLLVVVGQSRLSRRR